MKAREERVRRNGSSNGCRKVLRVSANECECGAVGISVGKSKVRGRRSKLKSRGHVTKGKWAKTVVLLADPDLRKYIPETHILKKNSLKEMLEMYKMVYVKPTNGSLGRGVMRVEKTEVKGSKGSKYKYMYQLGQKKSTYSTYDSAFQAIQKDTDGKVCIIQKGIHLLKHKGRRFDIRLVVQRAPYGGWEATGTVGRAAHPRKIVTNGSQGGTIYPTALLLKRYTSASRRKALLNEMNRIGVRVAKRFQHAYPGILEIGLDLAIDRKLKPWILEVNTIPDPCPFALLPDPSMLRKIIRYGKAYGKTYRLVCKKAKRGIV